MTEQQILVERRDDVVVLTLHRPDRLNAWTPQMSGELTDAIEHAEDDPAVGAVVVTGAGRGFCAGADIEAAFAGREPDAGGREQRRDWVELCRSTKPLVAAVNGVAVGIGVTLVLPFDRIVASEQARLSLRFVKMGLVPELASSRLVPQRCGFGVASDLMLSGRMVEADEAARLGLVDEVVAHDELLDVALARARSYGQNPAPQLRWIKQLLTVNATETDLATVQRRELELLEQAYASAEHKEAVAAFLLERRTAKG